MSARAVRLIAAAAILILIGVTALLGSSATPSKAAVFEAETGILAGTTVERSAEGYSGSGYVTGFEADSDAVAVTVQAPQRSLYLVTVGYRSPNGDKAAELLLDGRPFGQLQLKRTERFAEASAGKMLLDKGEHVVQFKRGWGYYDIDYVKLEATKAVKKHEVTSRLSNPEATAEAKALMSYLTQVYGKRILSGQQELDNVDWIEKLTGRKPAVVGFDLMDYSPSRAERGASSYEIDKALGWHRQGGIVAFVWHWNAPKGLIDEPGKEWWRGFYTDAVAFDLDYALKHPDSEDYALLLRDIDAIGEKLSVLREERVPVLFRPLHEAEGGWFWWGAKGPGPAKELYRIVYGRLTNGHKLNNLIWVWNSEDPEWYPGDDVVDIVSVDSYPAAGDHNPVSGRYDNLVRLVGDKKLVALTENGSIPDPDLIFEYGAHWSWFSTWTGEFLTDGVHNDQSFLQRVYSHPKVITLDELPDLYAGR